MKTIIYKDLKKAKVYKVYASKDQGVYKKDELIYTLKTDDISKHEMNGRMVFTYAVEQP